MFVKQKVTLGFSILVLKDMIPHSILLLSWLPNIISQGWLQTLQTFSYGLLVLLYGKLFVGVYLSGKCSHTGECVDHHTECVNTVCTCKQGFGEESQQNNTYCVRGEGRDRNKLGLSWARQS